MPPAGDTPAAAIAAVMPPAGDTPAAEIAAVSPPADDAPAAAIAAKKWGDWRSFGMASKCILKRTVAHCIPRILFFCQGISSQEFLAILLSIDHSKSFTFCRSP
jgi:hypothetical protein